jgi:hypothetical protein
LAVNSSAWASTTITETFTVNTTVPDNNDLGLTEIESITIGLDPNGQWVLYVVDQGPGAESVLQSWSLNITAVPEPSAAVLGFFSTALLMRRRRNPKL